MLSDVQYRGDELISKKFVLDMLGKIYRNEISSKQAHLDIKNMQGLKIDNQDEGITVRWDTKIGRYCVEAPKDYRPDDSIFNPFVR